MKPIPQIQMQAAHEKLNQANVVFVDIRDPGSFQRAHIPGAIHLDDGNIQEFIQTQPHYECKIEKIPEVACHPDPEIEANVVEVKSVPADPKPTRPPAPPPVTAIKPSPHAAHAVHATPHVTKPTDPKPANPPHSHSTTATAETAPITASTARSKLASGRCEVIRARSSRR